MRARPSSPPWRCGVNGDGLDHAPARHPGRRLLRRDRRRLARVARLGSPLLRHGRASSGSATTPGFGSKATAESTTSSRPIPSRPQARRARFRTARILYPAVAHVLALGRASLVGWTLLLVNVLSIVRGTAILQRLLERRGLPGWAALAYGLWGGLGAALLHGTAEPVAYLCVLAGLAAQDRGRPMLAGMAYLGGLLGRETTGALAAPYLLAGRGARPGRRPRRRGRVGPCGWRLSRWPACGPLLQPGLGPRLPLVSYGATRWLDLPPTLLFLVLPALLVLGWAVGALRVRPADASVWAAGRLSPARLRNEEAGPPQDRAERPPAISGNVLVARGSAPATHLGPEGVRATVPPTGRGTPRRTSILRPPVPPGHAAEVACPAASPVHSDARGLAVSFLAIRPAGM